MAHMLKSAFIHKIECVYSQNYRVYLDNHERGYHNYHRLYGWKIGNLKNLIQSTMRQSILNKLEKFVVD
jgi:hypothetical protein